MWAGLPTSAFSILAVWEGNHPGEDLHTPTHNTTQRIKLSRSPELKRPERRTSEITSSDLCDLTHEDTQAQRGKVTSLGSHS